MTHEEDASCHGEQLCMQCLCLIYFHFLFLYFLIIKKPADCARLKPGHLVMATRISHNLPSRSPTRKRASQSLTKQSEENLEEK